MWAYLKNRSIHKIALLIAVDILIIVSALYASYTLKFFFKYMRLRYEAGLHRIGPFFFIVLLSHMVFLYMFGLYSAVRVERASRLFLYISFSITASTALLMVVQFFFPGYLMGRVVLLLQCPLCTVGLSVWRSIANKSRISDTRRKNLVLIGPGPLITGFLRDARAELVDYYEIRGIYLTSSSEEKAPLAADGSTTLYDSLDDAVGDPNVEAVGFQALDPALSGEGVEAILKRACGGLEVCDLITLYKNMTGKVPLRYLAREWLLSYFGIHGGPTPFYLKVKRLMDLAVSSVLLAILSPLMGVIALCIRLDSKGPVFFKQERLGRHRKAFQCIKFRTMIKDAELDTGPVWASDNDNRITRVGRWLRKFRLDEVPQLLNVLKGDMSLIGPRPIRRHFADMLSAKIPLYELRFALKPGLTGWSQVNHPYAGSEEAQMEKFEYELFYIQNASLLIDGLILIKTLRTVFLGTGR